VLVGRSGRGRHDARRKLLGDRHEAAEVGRDELDVCAAIAQRSLGRPEEPAAQTDAGLREDCVQVEEQRAEHLEPLPVVALAQRMQQPVRRARTQRNRQGVGRPKPRRRLPRAQLARGHCWGAMT